MDHKRRSSYPTLLVCSAMLIALSACERLPFLDSSNGAISACEEKLKQSLESPSSYKRQNANYNTQEFTFDDYYESQGGDACKPYTSGECDDATKLLRAVAVKTWLLASDDIKAGRNFSEIFDQVDKQPFPKVSDKKKWQAERDYMQFVYQRRFGSGKALKLPAAIVGIEYDAVNSFNASLRSTYVCRFPPTESDQYSGSAIY